MTVSDILQESSFIEMSLSNLGIYNEGIQELAMKGVAAVVRMITKFITWMNNTVIPFLKKIAKAIANLIRKTKVGKKIFDKLDAKKKSKIDDEEQVNLDDDDNEDEKLSKMKRSILKNPTWLNYVAHSIVNPNAVMKLANSTEDRSEDIKALEERINQRINDGRETRIVIGLTVAQEQAREQLEIMEKAIMTFESNSQAIIDRCEELKRKISNANDNGSAMRARNASAVIQLMTRKTSEIINLSSENVLRLQKVVDPFKK